MRLPCCLNNTPDNIDYAKRLIDDEARKKRFWVLVANPGNKLEFVPKKSLELVKQLMPDAVIL